MIRHLAPLLLVAGAAVFPGNANAAIFRITEDSPAPLDGTTITNYPAGTFTADLVGVPKNFSVVGDFRVETDYLNASGQTVTGSKKLTAWNITVTNITDANSQVAFTRNMPNMADTSFTADTPLTNSFTVCLGTVSCDATNQLTLNFSNNFNATISDSIGTASGLSTDLSTLSYTVGGVTAANYSSLDVQADFVPFGASAFAFCPVVMLARRFAAKGHTKSAAKV